MSPNARGAFIVIEGLDRSGKTTQADPTPKPCSSNSPVRVPPTLSLFLTAILTLLLPPSVFSCIVSYRPRARCANNQTGRRRSERLIDAYLRSETELDDHAIHLPLLRQQMGTRVRRPFFSSSPTRSLTCIYFNDFFASSTIQAHLASGTTVIADRYAFSGIAFSAQKSPQLDLTYEWCRAPEIGLPAPDLTLFLDITPEIATQRGGYGQERYEKQEVQTRVRQVFEKIGKEMGADRWAVLDAGQGPNKVADDIWTTVVPVLRNTTDKPVTRLWHSEEESG
ncbi:P-loop containing nucleoside triphosphate hydrolase protein [Butyriboletus roseoflavus]|nr:P-loop containing nucleoside triphosphate hydrolase protein [Butyriboletus roseoflavus]